ncbi:uncharacterized protein A1O9_11347 [Exophiala aquamarina CBS 119918]|uniref:Nucleoside phosphorylase domain-containing protein n=1 Tax=Exophiala aquamarina CBS 119918 TaxID=1182545 RepID=A0A072PA93_9EURO|nr:uncharacterized protein A1O9_11347 [Exophiala aquamarina CBS 119918]KEF52505.1 hypothetical protein A1O9_11347 [Exophiala aquamarina CBS 119918]
MAAVEGMLEEIHDTLPPSHGQNAYTFGRLAGHNVVVAAMPQIGNNAAASVATQLLNDFGSIRFGLLVGIGGGIPGKKGEHDIRLGDVVVSQASGTFGGVVQYDMGKVTAKGRFERGGVLCKPPSVLSANVERLKSKHHRLGNRLTKSLNEMLAKYPRMVAEYSYPGDKHDRLFKSSYRHTGGSSCQNCDLSRLVLRTIRSSPDVHYGTIASGNTVIKDSSTRDRLQRDLSAICVDMEAAGVMDTTLPCLVIRGICDYADSHKSSRWQPYAAAIAAAYAKELLTMIPVGDVQKARPVPISDPIEPSGNSMYEVNQVMADALQHNADQTQEHF